MREIKFRAWGKNSKEFIAQGDGLTLKEIQNIEDIDSWEFQQFTGLRDKNGKGIYEGDIVKKHESIYQVIWHAGGLCAIQIIPEDTLGKVDNEVAWYLPHSLENFGYEKEVIGNIYENPELLKESP